MVNPKLKMVVVEGDGDGYGIGVGHFVHASRRNLNMTYMVMNNQIYGLTLGQSSPSSQTGHVTLTTPEGVDERPVNPINLSLAAGATFVARAFTGDSKHLLMIIEKALQHDGFAFIDVLSPCVTFNKLNTYDWFRERVYKLEEGTMIHQISHWLLRKVWNGVVKYLLGFFTKEVILLWTKLMLLFQINPC